MSTLTKEEYWAKINQLKAKYEDFCEPAPVKVLNLIMKREFAEQILRGEKKIEFRPYSQHYCDRLFDRKVTEFMNNHCDDDDVALYCDDMRPVKKIHFHNYNNSWHLDCKCNLASDIAADDEGVDFLHKEYGCNELDALNAQVKSTKGMNYPMFFFFVLGEIIDTDLNV